MTRADAKAGSGAKTRRAEKRKNKFNPKSTGGGGGGDDADARPTRESDREGRKGGKKSSTKSKTSSGKRDDRHRREEKPRDRGEKRAGAGGSDGGVNKKAKQGESSKPLSRKEQKSKSDEMKALRKPNFALVQELAQLWERMRAKKVSKTDRSALCDEIYKKCSGKVPELANNHKGSRVVQAVLKYGTPEQCASVMAEVTPQIALLSKSLYGNFLVRKLIDSTEKKDVPKLLGHLKGQIPKLARHPVGSQIVEALYHVASAKDKKSMTFEFYGPEFVHFGVAEVGSLREALLTKPVAQRQSTLRHVNASMIPVLEKGLVSSSVIHRVLAEYLSVGGPSTKAEAAGSIAAAGLLRMFHTKEGAHAVNMMLAHSGAKQRKGLIKALKGQITRVSQDDFAHLVIAHLFDCVDDTQLLTKGVLSELKQEGLEEIASHKNARRVLLHILNPRSTRYFPPHLLECLPDPAKVRADAEETLEVMRRGGQAEKDAKQAVGKEDSDDERPTHDDDEDEEDDDEEDEQDGEDEDMGIVDDELTGEGEDEDEDDDGDLEEAPADGPDFGIAKKPASTRRAELFGQGLGDSLIAACSVNAASMLRSNLASDVLFEVAAGGGDDVFHQVMGDKKMSEFYEAISRAVTDSMKSEEVDEETGEKAEPLCSNFFSTRTLRRMALEVKHQAFVPTFWNTTLKLDLKTWISGHGAKVVAAVVRANTDAKTRKEILAAVGKFVEGGDVEAWCAGFFRTQTEPVTAAASSTKAKSNGSLKSAPTKKEKSTKRATK